jgi:hypothetical protein
MKTLFQNGMLRTRQFISKIKYMSPKAKIFTGIGMFLLAVLVISGIIIVTSGLKMKAALLETNTHARFALDSLKGQNLPQAKASLEAGTKSLQVAEAELARLAFLTYSPAHWHYQDAVVAFTAAYAGLNAGTTAIEAIEPYADIIGFQGEGSFTGGTTEDRIVKIIETLDKINPQLDAVQTQLGIMNQAVSQINPKRYPYIKLQGQSVADIIGEIQTQIQKADTMLMEIRPALNVLPEIAGVGQSKQYLILFQNDAELRATGGFMTAFAILKVENGKVIPEKSSDIYDLDNKFTQRIPPPDILRKYLNVSRFHLRDMNISPDFKISMEQFAAYYNELPGEPEIDGVITVDTTVLTDLVDLLGPITVPGYGQYSAEIDPRCDCPQVFYELEEIADRPTYTIRTDRKAILGPMMQTILNAAFDADKDIWPSLFGMLWNSLEEKHILMYFFNSDYQTAAEILNMAGRIKTFDGDYIHINDSNLGGAKSSLFVNQSVDQEIAFANGTVQKTVTITYRNPRKGDNCNLEAGQLCLNGRMPNWTRIYLPKDAVISEVLGFDADSVKESEEFDKKVVEGVFILNPESQVRIKLTYSLPLTGSEYRLLIQKQPGTKNSPHLIHFNNTIEKEFELATDTEITFPGN